MAPEPDTPPPTPAQPARRADAERNRERILTAARIAFAAPGGDVSMAEIARRAGVGQATLYRNFAGRHELLEALYIDEVDGICAAAETVAADGPGAVLNAWLERFFAYFTSKRHVARQLFEYTSAEDPVFGAGRARIEAAAQPLLAEAQQAGEIRGDLTVTQILDLVAAVGTIPGPREFVAPILRAALDGLSASAGAAG